MNNLKILQLRGSWLGLLLFLSVPAAIADSTDKLSAEELRPASIRVYRDPNCSCCHRWIEHLRENGFQVEDVQSPDRVAIKQQLGVPRQLAACHTAVVDDYVIEGHVPSADIKRLLTERPQIHGLSVPGMPLGSPGMEAGHRREAFSVLAFDNDGRYSRYTDYPAK